MYSSKRQDNPTVRLDPKTIVIAKSIQSRVKVDETVVAEYVEALERGATFPPIHVFFNSKTGRYYVADGFHRLLAHLRARPNDLIECVQHIGTEKDALWYAIGCNAEHGLRRNRSDILKAVEIALKWPENMCDSLIARHVHVSRAFVQGVRKSLEAKGRLDPNAKRMTANGRKMSVTENMSKKREVVRSCGSCVHYDSSSCTLDYEVRAKTTPACEQFTNAGSVTKPKTKRVARRKMTECVPVPLSRSDVELSAVEIRHFFGDSYATALGHSLLRLVRESDE